MATVTITAASPVITGKGKAARLLAFASVPALAYGAESARQQLVNACRVAAGTSPDSVMIEHLRVAITVGTVGLRLPADERPKGCNDPEKHLAFADDIVRNYVPMPAGGAKSKLKAGKKGYRSPIQQRITATAREYASKLLADAGIGDAKTTTQSNADKRKHGGKPSAQPGGGTPKGAAKPDATELVKAPVTNREQAVELVMQHNTNEAAAAKKHAKLLPLAMAQAVEKHRTEMLKLMNEHLEDMARADARAAELAKQDI